MIQRVRWYYPDPPRYRNCTTGTLLGGAAEKYVWGRALQVFGGNGASSNAILFAAGLACFSGGNGSGGNDPPKPPKLDLNKLSKSMEKRLEKALQRDGSSIHWLKKDSSETTAHCLISTSIRKQVPSSYCEKVGPVNQFQQTGISKRCFSSALDFVEDNRMANRISATYGFIGPHVNPNEITAATGIAPDRTWKAGNRVFPARELVHPNSGWIVASKSTSVDDLGDHIQSILEQLAPSWNAVCDLATRYDAGISCAIYLHSTEATPGIHLEVGMLRRVVELNASFDLDLYCWPSDAEEINHEH